MPKFQHFIITPFNVDIGVKPREYILGTQYLENRLKIFQEVSYPSVYNQSNQNFQWLSLIQGYPQQPNPENLILDFDIVLQP